jgi:hypothetical protein
MNDLTVARRYIKLYDSAKSRNIPFDLSLKRVKQVLNTKKCYISGVELTNQEGDNQRTFDRKDNTLGYTDNNVFACSRKMNGIKANLTIEEIKLLYRAVKD